MDERHKKLMREDERLFNRQNQMSFWQEVALNFYPEMAEFTTVRAMGEEFADHLTTSFPILARRELGDAFSALLRPVNLDTSSPGVWFAMKARGAEKDGEARRWVEMATGIQRRAMYDIKSRFVRATKEGDHSFAAFGQCVISVELNRMRDGLLYRSWHLKDVAWREDSEGQICEIHRKWKPTAQMLVDTFRERVSPKVQKLLKDEPHKEIDVRHIIVSADHFDFPTRLPYISLFIDVENQHVMEEKGVPSRMYVIPRWASVPGSQYAISPAVVAALPDARLVQAMTLTMLESAEKFADPPMLATQNAIRSDVDLSSGGVTWVDSEYDERMGQALKSVYDQRAGEGLRAGMELRSDIRDLIHKSFFLDSLSLPPADVREMTAFEVGTRISEWIRRAMPIFEPMEFEYNGEICEETFGVLMRSGGFGPWQDIPESIRGSEIKFEFESPLHEGADRKKGQRFLEAVSALGQAAQLDPSTMPMIDARAALRDTLQGIGVPQIWLRDEQELDAMDEARKQQEAMQQSMMDMGGAAQIAESLGGAAKDFTKAAAT